MNRRNFIKACAVAGLGSSTALSVWASERRFSDLYAQSFSTLQGENRAMSAYLGRPLLVNFWATWCAPCLKEMPELEALSHDFPAVRFVGIAVDTQANTARFLRNTPVNYDILVAGHRGVGVMRDLGNRKGGLPYTLVLNADGQVQHEVLGQIKQTELATVLAAYTR